MRQSLIMNDVGNFFGASARVEEGGERRPLFGIFPRDGVSVELHKFPGGGEWVSEKTLASGSLEICVNFSGVAGFTRVRVAEIVAGTVSYYTGAPPGWRKAGAEQHRFVTIRMARTWLRRMLGRTAVECPAGVRAFLEGGRRRCRETRPMPPAVRQAAEAMIHAPGGLREIWFPAKILEVVAHVFTPPEFSCERQKHVARERVNKVRAILARNIENPPALPDLALEVGCSPFYLSRIFSEETGQTIPRHVRTLRLERAAELLRTGRFNVTEAAMEVGYSSLSHFSKAFAEHFGHCPCVFSLQGKP